MSNSAAAPPEESSYYRNRLGRTYAKQGERYMRLNAKGEMVNSINTPTLITENSESKFQKQKKFLKRGIARASGIGSAGNTGPLYEDTYKTAIENVHAAERKLEEAFDDDNFASEEERLNNNAHNFHIPASITSETIEKNLFHLLKVAEDIAATKGAEIVTKFKQEAERIVRHIYERKEDEIGYTELDKKNAETGLSAIKDMIEEDSSNNLVGELREIEEKVRETSENVIIAKRNAAAVLASPYLSEEYKQVKSRLRNNNEIQYLIEIYNRKQTAVASAENDKNTAQTHISLSKDDSDGPPILDMAESQAELRAATEKLAVAKREATAAFDAIFTIPDDGPDGVAALRTQADSLFQQIGTVEDAVIKLSDIVRECNTYHAIHYDDINITTHKSIVYIRNLQDRVNEAMDLFTEKEKELRSAKQEKHDAERIISTENMLMEDNDNDAAAAESAARIAKAQAVVAKADEQIAILKRERDAALASPLIPFSHKQATAAQNRTQNVLNIVNRSSRRKGRRSTSRKGHRSAGRRSTRRHRRATRRYRR